jgi:hypothetical protein
MKYISSQEASDLSPSQEMSHPFLGYKMFYLQTAALEISEASVQTLASSL